MKGCTAISILGLMVLLTACAANPLPPPQWGFEKDAIGMHIKADAKLNLDDGDAHTLLLCTYQLSDPNGFNQLSNDQDGLYTLLECGLFGSGAVASKRMIVQPGQTIDLTLDRAEGARYMAFVAGYAVLETARMVRMVEIPDYVEKKGILKRTVVRRPAPMDINIVLGPRQITTVSTSIREGK